MAGRWSSTRTEAVAVARRGGGDVRLGEAREDVKRTQGGAAKPLVASKCAGVASIAGLTTNRERGGGLDERALGEEVGKEKGGRGFDPKGAGRLIKVRRVRERDSEVIWRRGRAQIRGAEKAGARGASERRNRERLQTKLTSGPGVSAEGRRRGGFDRAVRTNRSWRRAQRWAGVRGTSQA